MSPLPTLVIIPGSFSAVKNYDVLVASLASHGVTSVIVVDLPSTKRRPDAPPATLTDDANEIVRVAEPLLDAGKSLVFLTHSYGGVPGNESLQRLSAKARAAQGKPDGIENHVYLSSIALPVGVSNLAVSGGVLPDFVTREVRRPPPPSPASLLI
jgi:surfactin synthase thioesterase subunit